MTRRLFVICAVLAALPLTGEAHADEAEWLYEPDEVAEISVDLSDESRAALNADPDEYVEATFSLEREDGTTYGPLVVGLRLKGSTSFRTLARKAAFKVKFNEFVSGQKFLGLKSLTLNNMVQDWSMLRETLAYTAFRAAGLAAPRTGYAYVRINGDDYGVYLNVETPDDVFLPAWYGTTEHLYEGELHAELRPDRLDFFEVEEGDDEDLSDLLALMDAVATWSGVDAVADLDQLTRFWAVEHYIGHWDGYSATYPNNYYLHSDDAGRFTMIPWGTDLTWERRLAYADDGSRMFDACIADPACSALYAAAVEDVRATLSAADLDLLASDVAALLYPWQKTDPRREHTLQQTRESILRLHAFLEARPSDDIWRTPAAPSPPAPDPPGDDAPPPPRDGGTPPPDTGPAPPVQRPFAIGSVRAVQGLLVATVDVPGAGALTTRAVARLGGDRATVCRGERRIAGIGTVRVWCPLKRAARRRLRTRGLRLDVRVRLVAEGGPTLAAARRVALSR